MASLTSPLTPEDLTAAAVNIKVRDRLAVLRRMENDCYRASRDEVRLERRSNADLATDASALVNAAAEADLIWDLHVTAGGLEVQYSNYDTLAEGLRQEAVYCMMVIAKREIAEKVRAFLSGHVPVDFDGQTNTGSANANGGAIQ